MEKLFYFVYTLVLALTIVLGVLCIMGQYSWEQAAAPLVILSFITGFPTVVKNYVVILFNLSN